MTIEVPVTREDVNIRRVSDDREATPAEATFQQDERRSAFR
jgi:hypothetical protein